MNKKIVISLVSILAFTFFIQTANACLYILSVINHETRECGYYDFGSRCPETQPTITKIKPIDGWEFIKEDSFWKEKCEAMGYTWVEDNFPHKKVINYSYLFKITLIIFLVGLIILFIIPRRIEKKRKNNFIRK